MKKDLPYLTKSEEQVMLKLWSLGKTSVKSIVELYDAPQPAYNTVSTLIRILETKRFVGHEKKGRGYLYFPKISKEYYASLLIEHLQKHYFHNDQKKLLSTINQSKRLEELL